jgi:hypothetical protein
MEEGKENKKRMELSLKAENVLEEWARRSLPELKQAMKDYRAYCEMELRKSQRDLVLQIERNDMLSREVVKLRRQIAGVRESLGI